MNDSDMISNLDFEFSRRVYYELINKGLEQLDRASDLADQLQHPRAFEVVGSILKNVADTNEKLLDLSKKKKEISGKIEEPKTTNNNLFIGSTSELQKLLIAPPKDEINVTPESDERSD